MATPGEEGHVLDTFGVSMGSEAVYRAMLQHPDKDLEGLARTLGRRVEEVRAALDDLADLALVDHAASDRGRLLRHSSGAGHRAADRP